MLIMVVASSGTKKVKDGVMDTLGGLIVYCVKKATDQVSSHIYERLVQGGGFAPLVLMMLLIIFIT